MIKTLTDLKYNWIVSGAAVGYMMGHGGAGMLSGIDGGPRMALGGTYVGL